MGYEHIIGTFGNKEDKPYVNRFITFYTLRYLWKNYKNSVPELHKMLFSSLKVKDGRTSYNKLLQPNGYVTGSVAQKIESITGVNQRYFTGENYLAIVDLPLEIWWEFIRIWNIYYKDGDDSKDGKARFKKIESEVHEKIIRAGGADLSNQSEVFQRLAYFARYKCKRTTKVVEDGIAEVEKLMRSFQQAELEQVDIEKLEHYRNILKEHSDRVAAICILKKWK